jgi:hypothetical protein
MVTFVGVCAAAGAGVKKVAQASAATAAMLERISAENIVIKSSLLLVIASDLWSSFLVIEV